MRSCFRSILLLWTILFVGTFVIGYQAAAQASGTIEGVVRDQTGAVVPGAKVTISYSVSGYQRETTTASGGDFRFANVPFNPYHLTVTASGFAPASTDVEVRSLVAVNIP